MHQCLLIVEVQRAVFREVHGDANDSASLAILARTCRAFTSVALDVLWQDLDAFVRLIQCLPQDLWRIDKYHGRLNFHRSMSISDWEMFFKYSTRVRSIQEIGLEEEGFFELADDVVVALCNPPTFGPLVPYLKTLGWDRPNKKYAPLLRLLLTPSLSNLSLQANACILRTPEVSILSTIGITCRSLKRLTINTPVVSSFLDEKGAKILSAAMLYLHSLEELTCGALDEDAVAHLSRVPWLRQLEISLMTDFSANKIKPLLAPPVFANIVSLTLTADTMLVVTSILEATRFAPNDVAFYIKTLPTVDAIQQFYTTLANSCDVEELCNVSLAVQEKNRLPMDPHQQLDFCAFQPLLELPYISCFTLDVPWKIGLDDADMTTLAKSWRYLDTLAINPTYGWGTRSRVTHRGLISLIAHCPVLADIAFSVDFSGIDFVPSEMPSSRPGAGQSNEGCSIADFVTSKIENPASIAAFLSDVCPNLHSVTGWTMKSPIDHTDTDDAEVYRERWAEVETILPAFTAVGRQWQAWNKQKALKSAPRGADFAA